MPYVISTPIHQTQSYYNNNFLVWEDGTVNFPPYTLKGALTKVGDNGDLVISGSVSTTYLYTHSLSGLDLSGVVFKSQLIASLGVMNQGTNLVYGNSSVANTVYLPTTPVIGDYVYFINNQSGAARVTITVNGNGNSIFTNLNTVASSINLTRGLFYWDGNYWYLLTN
jgi:hypothetical protein